MENYSVRDSVDSHRTECFGIGLKVAADKIVEGDIPAEEDNFEGPSNLGKGDSKRVLRMNSVESEEHSVEDMD